MIPAKLQKEAGWRTDPPVSVPSEAKDIFPATDAADPPLDPPGTYSIFQGFFVGPKNEVSLEAPIANSSRFVFPVMRAPACLSRVITVAS